MFPFDKAGVSLAGKYLIRINVTNGVKRTSLERFGINYSSKMFRSLGALFTTLYCLQNLCVGQ
jgi:hypothetical protein